MHNCGTNIRSKRTTDLTSSERHSFIRNLIHLYATKAEHLTGKKFKVEFGNQCCVNLSTGVVQLPDVVCFADDAEKQHKTDLLLFGARHEFGHLLSTDPEKNTKWHNKVPVRERGKLAYYMNVFEDIREEHMFCKVFPGAIKEMRDFSDSFAKMHEPMHSDPKVPMFKKLFDLIYVRSRSAQYKSYGLAPYGFEAPREVEEAYDKYAKDLVERSIVTEDQEETNACAYEFYLRMKSIAEDEAPKAPPLAVGDFVRKEEFYGEVISIDGFDVEVEVISKEEAKKRMKAKA